MTESEKERGDRAAACTSRPDSANVCAITYYDDAQVSQSWLAEAREAVTSTTGRACYQPKSPSQIL
jgi:hypothetical protein